MRVTQESQLKMNGIYYFANYYNKNLDGQPDGVYVYKVMYKDITKEYKSRYGMKPPVPLAFKYIETMEDAVENPSLIDDLTFEASYMKYYKMYTTIEEARRDAIYIAFTLYTIRRS